MIFCPNKAHPQYKKMVEAFGDPRAHYLYTLNKGNFLTDSQIEEVKNKKEKPVQYQFKLIELISYKYELFDKLWNQFKNKSDFFKKLNDNKYGLPKEQVLLLEALYNGQSFNDLMIDFISNYSYTIEIDTAKRTRTLEGIDEYKDEVTESTTDYYSNLTVPGGTNYIENEIATPAITPFIKGHAQFTTDKGIGWFRSDEQINGYGIEQGEKSSLFPLGLSKQTIKTNTKTRRILEVQSDLFQKGRDKNDLINGTFINSFLGIESYQKDNFFYTIDEEGDTIKNDLSITDVNNPNKFTVITLEEFNKNKPKEKQTTANQFLQLLNKNNNWVSFFVKSIIQDSLSKGYEKVLFPTGNTASKVEGHSTLEEFKKQKEYRIKQIDDKIDTVTENYLGFWSIPNDYNTNGTLKQFNTKKEAIEGLLREKEQLKQELERVEKEGFGALRPIFNFYENTVTNILNKQGYEMQKITDEYGNTWNEITLTPDIESTILLDKKEGVKKGVQELFKENSELATIGTPEQYSQYLESVFPDSQIKDIVYHGAMEAQLPKDGKFKGYVTYFTNSKKYAETFGFPVNRKVISAIINVKKSYNSQSELADVPEEVHNTDQFTNPRIIKSNSKNYDSVIGIDAGQKQGETIAVFEPEQIHILGNEQDITGFKNFVNKNKSSDLRNRLFDGQSSIAANTMLSKIANSNHALSKLANDILNKFEKELESTQIFLEPETKTFNVNGELVEAAAYFDPSNEQIYVSEFATFRKNAEITILHEILHKASYARLRTNTVKAKQFERLFEKTKRQYEAKFGKGEYALSNTDEFLVALFTNGQFIKKLSQLPSNKQTVWDELKDFIKSLLKIKDISLFDDAFDSAMDILNLPFRNVEGLYAPVSLDLQSSLSKKLGINSKQVSNQQTINIKKNVEKYNRENNTSYFVKFKQLGQSTLYTWEIVDKANGQTKMFDKANKENQKTYSENELEVRLMEFAERHGISIEIVKDLRLNGKSVAAVADTLNRLIKLSEGSSFENFTEEIAHIAIELLGKDDARVIQLMESVVTTEKYRQVKEDYKDIYTTEEEFRKEAIGQLVRDALLNKYKIQESQSVISSIRGFVNRFITKLKSIVTNDYKADIQSLINDIANNIVENTIKENKNPLEDVQLAAIIDSEKEIFIAIQSTLSNRINHLREKKKSVDSVIKKRTKAKEFSQKKDVKGILNLLSDQIEDDLLGFLKDRSAKEPSLVNTWLKNRSNFAITSSMLDEIYLFTNNYSSAIDDLLTFLIPFTSNLDMYTNEINKLHALKRDITDLQSYYKQWERTVLKNVLSEMKDGTNDSVSVSNLLDELYTQKTTKDSSWFRKFLGSARLASNPTIRLVFHKLAKYLDVVNLHTNEKANEIMELFREVKAAGLSIDDLIEDKDTAVKFLVSEYQLGKYEKDTFLFKLNALKEILGDRYPNDKLIKENQVDGIGLEGIIKGIMLSGVLTKDDKKKYNEKLDEWDAENLVTAKGTPIPDAYFKSKSAFMERADDSLFPFKLADKWKNPKYQSIENNATMKKFYDYLLNLRKEDLKRLPNEFNTEINKYRLPQVSQNFIDAIKDGKNLKQYLKDTYKIKPDEKNLYGEDVIVDYFGNEIKRVPINFFNNVVDSSTDIPYLFIAFTEMSKNYQVMTEASSDFLLLERAWGNKQYVVGKGYKAEASNDLSIIRNGIDKVIYGKYEDKIFVTIGNKKYEIGKLINKFVKYSSERNLGMNIPSALSNNIKANIDMMIEGLIGNIVSKADLAKGDIEFLKNGPSIFMEARSINPKNKLHNILIKNNLVDLKQLFRNADSNGFVRYGLTGHIMMSPFEMQEYQLRAKLSVAVMNNFRIKDGVLISKKDIGKLGITKEEYNKLPTYYDNYEEKDGKIVEKVEISEADKYKVRDRIKYVMSIIDGKMTAMERGKAYNNAIAKMILNHRSWLVSGIDRRFKKELYNYSLDEDEVGYYRAFMKMISLTVADRATLLKFQLTAWDKLSDQEKIGVKKTLADLVVLTSLVAIWALLQGIADDDDEWHLDAVAYLSSRVLLEHASFISPTEVTSLFSTPFAAADTLNSIQTFFLHVIDSKNIDRGQYEGFQQWEKNIIKLIPGIRQLVEMRDPASKDKFIKAKALQIFSPFDPTKE